MLDISRVLRRIYQCDAARWLTADDVVVVEPV
jgi:hypothetical protein